MAEQKQMEMLSALMGEEGQDAAKMLLRMQRLQRLLGAPQDTALPPAPQEEADVFSRRRRENMISAAIPFLNREYQKELYLVVRLMELRRVMGSELLETRERQEAKVRCVGKIHGKIFQIPVINTDHSRFCLHCSFNFFFKLFPKFFKIL